MNALEKRIETTYEYLGVTTHAVNRYRSRVFKYEKGDEALKRKIIGDVRRALDNGKYVMDTGTTMGVTNLKVNCGNYRAIVVNGTVVTVYKDNLAQYKGKKGRRYR